MKKPSGEHRDPMEDRGIFEKFADFLFGYDFFISYCWADGRQYAVELQKKLEEHGFKCFLDSNDYAKGDNWRAAGRRALKKTSRLILVGTPKAVLSEPVANELRIFSSLKRRIFPIDFGGALSKAGSQEGIFRYLDPDMLRVVESDSSLAKGPSEDVLSQIHSSFNLLRQDQKRNRWLTSLTTIFALVATLAVIASVEAIQQRAESQKKEREARENLAGSDLANAKTYIDKNLINQALHHFWKAYSHAPSDSLKKDSAQRLIAGWLPYAGKTVHADVDGNPLQISSNGQWVLASSSFEDRFEKVVRTSTGEIVLRLPISHDGSIRNFSPDGKLLAIFDPAVDTTNSNRKIRLFDLTNLTFRDDYTCSSRPLAFALRNSRELLMVTEQRNTLSHINLDSGQIISEISPTENIALVSGPHISLSADSNVVLFSTRRSHGFRNLNTGAALPIDFGYAETQRGALSAEGTYLSSTGDEVGTSVVATKDGNLWFDGFSFGIVIFHPNDPSVFAFPSSSEITLKNLEQHGEELDSANKYTLDGDVAAIAFDIEKNSLVSVDESNTYTRWDIYPKATPSEPSGFVFTKDCRHYLYKDTKGRTYVAQSANNKPVGPELAELQTHGLEFPELSVSHDSSTIAVRVTSEGKRKLFVFVAESGKLVSEILLGNRNSSRRCFFNSSGDTLVSFDSKGDITCWDITGGRETFSSKALGIKSPFHSGVMLQSAFNESCDTLVLKRGNQMQIWNIEPQVATPSAPISLELSPEDLESKPILSNDGKLIAAVSNSQGNKISVWNTSGELISLIPVGRGAPVSRVHFNQDGSQIAAVRSSALYVYDVTTRRKTAGPLSFAANGFCQEIHFSPDGNILTLIEVFVMEGDGYSVLSQWDIQSGIRLRKPEQFLTLSPRVRYSEDGKHLFLIEMSSEAVEKRTAIPEFGNLSLTATNEEALRVQLELTTGYAFGDDGDRTPLSRPAVTQREDRMRDLAGSVADIPEILTPPPTVPVESAPLPPVSTEPGETQNLESFLKNWIGAGNSDSQESPSQADFYYDPALIDGKSVSIKALEEEQQAFENAFPDRQFSLLGYDILSGTLSSPEIELSVLQHVFLKSSDGREREIEIRDDIYVIFENGTRKIKSRNRVDTRVIRDSQKEYKLKLQGRRSKRIPEAGIPGIPSF